MIKLFNEIRHNLMETEKQQITPLLGGEYNEHKKILKLWQNYSTLLEKNWFQKNRLQQEHQTT